MKPLGIYFHLPFCLSRCGYCDFAVVTDRDDAQDAYVSCLEKEIEFWSRRLDRKVVSLYFGGGTPSRLRPELWDRLFDHCKSAFDLDQGAEVTCEANPESATREILRQWKGLGINRISLGVQTFHAGYLKNLDRRHDPEGALAAIGRVRESGFENWSLDLIYGLPGQSLADWNLDLDTALSLDPPHLSFYNLILHPDHPVTEKAKAAWTPHDEDIQSEMFLDACERFESNGYGIYELSNAAKTGHECRHNRLYWQGGEWLGLGLSGSSCYQGKDFRNPKTWQTYLDTWSETPSDYPLKTHEPTKEGHLLDFLMLRLRTSEGFSLGDLESEFGILPSTALKGLLLEMRKQGYTQPDPEKVALTPKGWLLHSEVTTRILDSILKED